MQLAYDKLHSSQGTKISWHTSGLDHPGGFGDVFILDQPLDAVVSFQRDCHRAAGIETNKALDAIIRIGNDWRTRRI
jgi:hypothetical protein